MSVAGFDIGSQTSCVALARKRGIDVLLNKESNRETPSLASFGLKQRLLGTDAAGALTVNPKNTVFQLKRLIGKQWDDPALQADIARFPFKVVKAEDGGVAVEVQYLGETATFSPVQLMAMVLVDQREVAQADGSPVTDCVITVPVYFTEAERYAMLASSRIAGLTCLRLMNEPTATALAYGIYKTDLPETDPAIVGFVDMGHSSLQVSVVSFKKGRLEVLSHAWDRDLGGRDFDEVLFEHFVKEFDAKFKLDIKGSPRSSFRLRLACEKLKKVLSGNTEATIFVESLQNDVDASGAISRDAFEALCEPLVNRIVKPMQQAVAEAGVKLEQITSVELVGGSSRVPLVTSKLLEAFQRDPSRTLNAKESVSRGAALQCAMLSPIFRVRDFEVIDKAPYGVVFSWEKDGKVVESNVFDRNSSTPSVKAISVSRDRKFTIKAAYSPDSNLPVGTKREIAEWHIGPPPAPPADAPAKLKVKANLNLHGVVSIVNVTQIVEEEYEEPVKVSKPKAALAPADAPMQDADADAAQGATPAEDAEMKDADAAASDAAAAAGADGAGPSADATGAEPMEAEETVMQKKKRTVKKAVPMEASTLSVSDQSVMGYCEAEGHLAAQDRMQRDTNDKKNELESYIYSLRGKLTDVLSAYAPDSIKEALSARLTELEDWLYEEGEDQPKSVYQDQLKDLRLSGDPIEMRFVEEGIRSTAVASLATTAKVYKAKAGGDEKKYAHIDAADLKKVVEEADKTLAWLQEKVELQQQVKKHEDPVLLSGDIKKKEDTLRRVADPILSKPPPTPKKEEAKKEEAAPAPAEPTAEATGDATKEAVPDDGASVPSKVDIEEIPADDSSTPMESSVNDMD